MVSFPLYKWMNDFCFSLQTDRHDEKEVGEEGKIKKNDVME